MSMSREEAELFEKRDTSITMGQSDETLKVFAGIHKVIGSTSMRCISHFQR